MDNALIYYKKSGETLDFFEKNLQSANVDIKRLQKKFSQEKAYKEEKERFDDSVAFFHLCNSALFGINREKIENSINTNWDNYVPEFYSKSHKINYSQSKIPYFREWFGVFKCQERFKTESSKFWVKKIRDSLMHGNYEIDFNSKFPANDLKMKIVENSKNGVVFDAHVCELGLNEFIEDNFTNILKVGDIGVVSDDYYLSREDIFGISTRDELKKALDKLIIYKRKVKDTAIFDGEKVIDKLTGENITGIGSVVSKKEGKPIVFNGPKYFDADTFETYVLSDEIKEVLIHLLENNHIYSASKQLNLIKTVISENFFLNRSVCENIDTFKHLFEECAFRGEALVDNKVKPTLKSLYLHFDNREVALTLLRLYRMLYALQNPSFPEIDKTKVELGFFKIGKESKNDYLNKMDKKIDQEGKSFITGFEELTFELIRNALAHGNYDVQPVLEDGKLIKRFVFSDIWVNRKTGQTERVSTYASLEYIKKFVQSVESQIDAFVEQEEFFETKKFNMKKLKSTDIEGSLDF